MLPFMTNGMADVMPRHQTATATKAVAYRPVLKHFAQFYAARAFANT